LALVPLATSCWSPEPEPAPPVVAMCGSSTIGKRLAPRLANLWLGREAPFDHPWDQIPPPTAGAPWCTTGVRPGSEKDRLTLCVTYSGSLEAPRKVRDPGDPCQIGMLSGGIGDVDRGALAVTRIGSDPILVVASRSAVIQREGEARARTEVSLDQLRDWYAGRDVPEGLAILGRAEKAGTTAALQRLLGLEAAEWAPTETVAASDFRTRAREGGTWLFYVSSQEALVAREGRLPYRILSVRREVDEPAMSPFDAPTVPREHPYPLVRDLHLVHAKAEPDQGIVDAFTKWAANDRRAAAQLELLHMVHPTTQDVDEIPASTACGEDGAPVSGRLGFPLFYEDASVSLRDDQVEQLRSHVARAAQKGQAVYLVGYASRDGTATSLNCKTASLRTVRATRAIASEAEALGVPLRGVVAGPTTTWGPREADNRVLIPVLVDRDAPR